MKKYVGAKSVELVEGEVGVGESSIHPKYAFVVRLIIYLAHALFDTPANATRAVEKLHAHIFKGSLLSVTLKKRVESLAKSTKVDAKAGEKPMHGSVPAPSQGNRLIVRNLPWDVRNIIFCTLIRFN